MTYRTFPEAGIRALSGVLLAMALSGAAHAYADPPNEPADPASEPAADSGKSPPPGDRPAAGEPKPYAKVITSDAESQNGLITIHRIKSKLYFEIPKDLLGKPLLMVANATAVPMDVDHVGKALAQRIVRFNLRDNNLYLQAVDYRYTTEEDRANVDAVGAAQRDAILLALNVEAFSPEGAPVVEVTRLFTTEVDDFSARALVKATSLDRGRSYVTSSRTFPSSLRVDAVHTYMARGMIDTPMGPQPAPPTFPARAYSMDIAYSIVELPEKPMMPRLFDDRVGYFYVKRANFAADLSAVKDEQLIARWRLEKRDPDAAVSEPVKPIVWYIDSATPTALVPYIKRGVEAWNVAFEAAGFRNAVQARPFPSKEEDPEFDPEDVRYSIIRWVPSTVTNAYGPSLKDPRTGEILNANIVMYHNIQALVRDWYISQVGGIDPRAQKLPLPDDLMGDLVGYVVTHEVGHSLGFQHNMKASSQYPVEKLRDPEWLRTMGHVPSIMDYSRFNYLVQPEDGVDPALLLPKVGPYDMFATHWGYAPIPGASTPEDEKPTLDKWAREQDRKPWLRFSSPRRDYNDFGDLMEAVGDADAVTATELGIRNLQRLVRQLPGMTLRPGETDEDLENLYRTILGQWRTELGHVVAIVGSYEFHNKHGSQSGAVHSITEKARQARAVEFINQQVFQTPKWVFEPAIEERLAPGFIRATVAGSQRQVLGALLERKRLRNLLQQELARGDDAYRVTDLLAGLRKGVLGELEGGTTPSLPRRDLQRGYIDLLAAQVENMRGVEESHVLLRAELDALHAKFVRRARSSRDAVARAHWEALAHVADAALNPLPVAQGGRASPAGPVSALAAESGATAWWEEVLAGAAWSDASEESCLMWAPRVL